MILPCLVASSSFFTILRIKTKKKWYKKNHNSVFKMNPIFNIFIIEKTFNIEL
jgi:hypothetical protein